MIGVLCFNLPSGNSSHCRRLVRSGTDLAVLALKEEQRVALAEDDFLDFSDEDGMVAGILRAVQSAFKVR